MATELVLFDLDGTLIDSAPDLCAALAAALTDVGLPVHDVPAVRAMIGEGQRVLIERALTRAGAVLTPALIDHVLARFRAFYSDHLVVHTSLYPGVRQTLQALSAKCPLAVATNKPGAWARRIVEIFGLSSFFFAVLGEDDVGARKPDPRLLSTLCQRAGVAPSATLMVGDSAIDQQAAARAGTQLAFCTYGFADAETLAQLPTSLPLAGLGTAEHPFVLTQFGQLLDLPLFN